MLLFDTCLCIGSRACMLMLLDMVYAKVVASYAPHHVQQCLLRPDAWPFNLLHGVSQKP